MAAIDFKKYAKQRNANNFDWQEYLSDPRYIVIDDDHENVKSFHKDSTVQVNFDYDILPEILEATKRLEKKFGDHDKRTSEDHLSFEEKLNKALVENKYFRERLSEIHKPIKLQRYSLFYGFVASTSYVCSTQFGIELIHPYFAFVILFSSIMFYIMSVIMINQDKSN